jgi:hypothetical protein
MGITIDEITTEVMTEPQSPLAGSDSVQPVERLDEVARVRFALALAARLEQRTRAEGYDD